MPVNTPRDEYQKYLPRWQRCRDCYDGSDAVKARGTHYLPKLDSHVTQDMSPATVTGTSKLTQGTKYEDYKARALFYNATCRTVDGLSGAIFQKEPVIELPPIPNAEEDETDITMAGESLTLFALRSTREVLKVGRFGILVDMATEGAEELRPYWVGYHAEDIISWRVERYGGDDVLTRVVLRERVEQIDPKDDFGIKLLEQYRVLYLDDVGTYQQDIYVIDDPDKKESEQEFIFSETLTPMRRGMPLEYIPFVFIGPRACSPIIEKPPLDDLAEVNLSHYRGSADLKHGLHMAALPTPWAAGLAGSDTGPIMIGSGAFLQLTESGKAGMLEVAGPGFKSIVEDLDRMEKQMATLGARLLENTSPSGPEAAETVGMRHAGEQANLRTIANAVGDGLTQCLRWHGWWMSTAAKPEDVEADVELNTEFFTMRASPDQARAALLLYQADAISFETLYSLLQEYGLAREGVTASDEQKEIKKQVVARPAIEPGKNPNPNIDVGTPPPVPSEFPRGVPPPAAPVPQPAMKAK